MSPTLAEQLAEYVVTAKYEALPAAVVRHAKFVILDPLGVAVAGAMTTASRAVLQVVRRLGGPAEATVWRHGDKVSGVNAAFANSMFAHALDYNDDNAGVQVGAIAAPVAISIGEAVKASGREVITAVVIGHDVATRVALAADPQGLYRAGTQPTAFSGVFAGAAVAGRLLGLNADQLAHAFGIAGSYTGGTIEFLKDGANTKPLHAAKSAHLGALAAHLAAAGMTGPHSIFEGEFGVLRAFSRTPRPEQLIEGLGSRYDILQTSVKLYPCADGNAAPMQAALGIVREQKLALDEIESLHFRIKSFLIPFALRFNGSTARRYRPQNELDARMSMPYCVAMALLEDGLLKPDDFVPARFADPRLQALSDRITAEGDAELDKLPLFPMSMPAVATLTTRDGRVYTKRVDYQKGDPRNPFAPEEYRHKFANCVADILTRRQQDEIVGAIMDLERVPDIAGLTQHLVAA